LDKSSNIYDIKYIFEFDSEKNLTSELTEITRGIDSYMRNKTAFVENNIDDKISPIFTANKTIGNVYKYSPSYDDYTKLFDYSKYIKNDKLSKFISLYNFYERGGKNLNKSYGNISEKYYLIKSTSITQIKNNCGYDQMKQILDTKFNLELGDFGITTDDKKMLKIIKNIPKDILERNFSSNNIIRKIPKRDIEPEDKYIINQSNPNEMAIIYDNFGIIDKKVAEEFIEGISSSYSSVDKNVMDCTLINGRIIIEYKTSLGNSKYVNVIGSVDPNDFIIFNEYALIYKDYNGFTSHTITLKSKLNNFLQGLQLFNGTQPITDTQYKELGTLIQIEQTGNRPTPIKPSQSPNSPIPSPFTPSPNPPPPKPSPINDEYNLNSKLNISSIRQYFTYPPLIGLENIGATCYMNATLQCLCNIEKLVDYFKYNKHLIEIVKNDYYKKKLCSSFKLLIEKLWPDNFMQKRSTYYAPHDFKDNISTKNPLFQGVAANDSKDLVNFLIMTLHDELNKAKNFGGVGASFADQRNQQVMLNNFIKNFQATNQSIISDLFYAVNCNIIQCSLCKTQTFNYQTYFFIIFPLEEVRKFKFSNNFNQFNNFNNMFNNNEVNIYECFEYDKKITYMSGQNAMHCNYCQKTCNSSMCTLLTTGPEILILILNRGQGIEFKVKINFVERLNLANYIQFSNTGVNYELIGVITHMGENSMSGHFIAYCKSPISKTWFRYNDATVSPVGNFKSEVIDYAMPYLLFYQKMH
jgi:ubiquitin C-terminal hydrolase